MTISRITQKIHSKEANLWQIQRANEGVMPYAILHPNPEKRTRRTETLNKEIAELKTKRDKIKATTPKENWYPGRKNSGRTKEPKKQNTYLCSNGERVTQKEIDRLRSEAYRVKYRDNTNPIDEGFREKRAQCTAHIIPQARCKQLGKTELIWDIDNMFPATFESNAAIENPKGQAWKRLLNIDRCIQFIYEHDKELFFKFESQG